MKMFTALTGLLVAIFRLSVNAEDSNASQQGRRLTGKKDKEQACSSLDILGPVDDPNFDMEVSFTRNWDNTDEKEYALKFDFVHNVNLPLPTVPEDCIPPSAGGPDPPNMAPDGLPYLAGREFPFKMGNRIKRITGVNHASMDFNPCGHPPLGVFTVPHYDFHLYRVSPEYRTCMTCEMVPGAPICAFPVNTDGLPYKTSDPRDPNIVIPQDTFSGRAFYNPGRTMTGQLSNMPKGHVMFSDHSVPRMGSHAWSPEDEPAAAAPGEVSNWVDPIFIELPYDGQVIAFETMFPLSYITGIEDKDYMKELEYEGQTITLPESYTFKFDSETQRATVTWKFSV